MTNCFMWKKPKLFSYYVYAVLQISAKAKFHDFLGSSTILNWNYHRLKINSSTFYKIIFDAQNVSEKFFHWMGSKRVALARFGGIIQWKKLFRNILNIKNYFVKKSKDLSYVGDDFSLKWLNSPKKNHGILLRLKFEAVVDVIWK